MHKNDINANIEMYLKQILALADLMLETYSEDIPNILTIRDLAQAGLNKASEL